MLIENDLLDGLFTKSSYYTIVLLTTKVSLNDAKMWATAKYSSPSATFLPRVVTSSTVFSFLVGASACIQRWYRLLDESLLSYHFGSNYFNKFNFRMAFSFPLSKETLSKFSPWFNVASRLGKRRSCDMLELFTIIINTIQNKIKSFHC